MHTMEILEIYSFHLEVNSNREWEDSIVIYHWS